MPQRRFEALDNVPLGSHLEVWTALNEGHVQIDGLLVSGEGVHDDRVWTTGQLLRTAQHPNRAGRKRLSAAEGYYVRVSTFFEDRVEGSMTIRVLTPEGFEHEAPLVWNFSGSQGDNRLNGAFIHMQHGGDQ